MRLSQHEGAHALGRHATYNYNPAKNRTSTKKKILWICLGGLWILGPLHQMQEYIWGEIGKDTQLFVGWLVVAFDDAFLNVLQQSQGIKKSGGWRRKTKVCDYNKKYPYICMFWHSLTSHLQALQWTFSLISWCLMWINLILNCPTKVFTTILHGCQNI